MKRLLTSAAICVLAAGLVTGTAASADPHHGHGGWQDHSDFRNGGHVAHGDWDNAPRVDYRQHHLRKPPRGYEWRQSNGNYVLAAVATGAIISLIAAQH